MADGSTELPAQPTSTGTTSGARWRKHLVELATITVGVLIALSLEGVRQWVSDRALVREAERILMVEIEENRAEIEGVIAGDEQRQAALDQAIRFADELLEDGTTEVDELELGFSLAEVSSASWMTAERTGAIAHMEYERVRAMSRVYEAQDLFIAQQRQNLARLAGAMAILSASDDPTGAPADDLRRFREEVLGLRAELYIQRQLAERVRDLYVEALSAAGRAAEASPIP